MPDIDQFTKITQYLEQYGGWAVAVIMMVVILYLHRTTSNLLEKRNNELKSLLTGLAFEEEEHQKRKVRLLRKTVNKVKKLKLVK